MVPRRVVAKVKLRRKVKAPAFKHERLWQATPNRHDEGYARVREMFHVEHFCKRSRLLAVYFEFRTAAPTTGAGSTRSPTKIVSRGTIYFTWNWPRCTSVLSATGERVARIKNVPRGTKVQNVPRETISIWETFRTVKICSNARERV